MNRIKELRKLRKMTQQELARILDVTQGAIQKLEKGERGLDIDWMRKIAQALNVEPWELLPKDMQPNISPEEQEILRTIRKVKSSNDLQSTTKAS